MQNYAALVKQLRGVRAPEAKTAAAQTAQVPEKAPEDKGSAPAPAIVDADKAKQVEPVGASTNTNADNSPPNPTTCPAATVTVPEKIAAGNLVSRAAALAGTFGNLLKAAKKADATPVVPATPEEKKDDKKDDKKEEKAAAPAVPASTTATEKPAPAPTAAPVTAAPAGAGTAVNADVKAAGADEIVVPEFTPEFHAKIGSAMLQFAEGRDMVERCLRQLHGAEMAQDIIKSAAFMEEHALQLQQAELEGASAAEQLVSEMSAEDLKVASTLAEAHAYDLSGYATVEEQEAYKAAAAQAAGMVDEGMGGMDELPPEAHGEGGEQVSPEDILQVIEFLLSEGKISPEEAQKIVEELAGAAGGAEGDPGAGGPPMEEDPNMPPEEKEARVKFASAEKTFDQLIADAIK